MNDNEKLDKTRRNLIVATSAVGGAAGLGAVVPFAASMWPSERARAAGAPVEVDLSRIAPGELGVVEWRGKPVWILRRTKEMLESLKSVEPRLSETGLWDRDDQLGDWLDPDASPHEPADAQGRQGSRGDRELLPFGRVLRGGRDAAG